MTNNRSNTVKKQRGNPATLKPFKKGKGADIDPRINTKGRPKSFDQLRALFQDIATETITLNGKTYTRAQAIGLAMSADKKLMKDFLEYAYGKVPQKVEGPGEGGAFVFQSWKEFVESQKDDNPESSGK